MSKPTVKVAWNLPLCCKFLGKDLLSFRGQDGLEQSSQALTSPQMSTSSPSWCLTMMGRGTAGTATTQKSTWKSLRNTPKLTWWASSLLFYFAREDPRLSNLARLSWVSGHRVYSSMSTSVVKTVWCPAWRQFLSLFSVRQVLSIWYGSSCPETYCVYQVSLELMPLSPKCWD